jgi:acylpyruvate hydrolase
MRLVTFSQGGHLRLGAHARRDGRELVLDLQQAEPVLPAGMTDFLNAGDAAMESARQAIRSAQPDTWLPVEGVQLLAPVPRPGKIICLGHNYTDHFGRDRTSPPEFPTFFCKTVNTIIGSGQPIVIPSVTQQADFEAELAVVMGKQARRVPEERALDYVAGYTIFNDVSARDYQKRTSQWMIGKSFDTFGPMGPALVTAEEIPDPHTLEFSLAVNGVERQHTNTRNQIFSIPFLIAYLSAVMTLEPGDLLATGTPARTAPPPGASPFLQPGDGIRITMDRIGELFNPVIAGE